MNRPKRDPRFSAALAVVAILATAAACGEAPAPAPTPTPTSAVEAPPAEPAPDATGAWSLVALDGEAVAEDAGATLTVEPGGALSGSAGCNRYTAQATIDGAAMSTGPVAATRMACPEPEMDREMRFLAALGETATFEVDADALRLRDAGGTVRLEFRRAPEATPAD